MRYCQVFYDIGDMNRRIYPAGVDGVVWSLTQDHYADQVLVAGTEGEAQTDGSTVIELTDEEALALIEEFKQTYPRLPQGELQLPFRAPITE